MRKHYYRSISLAAMLSMLAVIVLAQERLVTGTVTDENGNGMPGVNVIIKGTTLGTSTDTDGKFSITANDQATLVFSFVGYATAEESVGTRTSISLKLEPDIRALTEVVVTGYTSQRKKDITGAVSVVKVDELQNIQAGSISQKLEGRASGVTISTSGEPGEGTNIRIRGLSSLQLDSDPLWVIDGVQSTDKGNTWLNPNDIESIQVLKDASSASIYGSRASNGVIIVTTKKGRPGKTRVTYSGYTGVQAPVKGYDEIVLLNPLDNAEAMSQFYTNSVGFANLPDDNYYRQYELNGNLPQYTWPVANPGSNGDLVNPVTGAVVKNLSDYYYSGTDDDGLIMGSNQAGTNWWDELFDPAVITEHNLGISGGNENAVFNFGTGYLNQKGTMIHTGFERLSIRANSQFKTGKFSFGENFTLARTNRTTQIGSNQDNQNSLTNTLLMHPVIPVYDIGGHFAGAKAISNGSNPVAAQVRNKDNGTTAYKAFGNVYAEVAITDWLRAKSNLGLDFSNSVFTGFNFATPENREPTLNNGFSETWSNNFLWQWSNTLEVSQKIGGKHQINVLVGYEAIENRFRGMSGTITRYFTEDINAWYLNAGIGDPGSRSVSSYGGPSTRQSVFGKIDYTFDDKYILSVTTRRDGSSNFGRNQRWGTFPAVSLGWRVSGEQFMSGVSFVTDLKLRAGYGVTGNQNIPSGNAFDQYGGSPGTSFYDINGNNTGAIATGFALTQFGNPDGKWERNISTNIGIDLSLLDGKIETVIDFYKRDVDGLLYSPPVAGTAGSAAQPYRNIGDMTNKGVDISVTYRGNLSGDLGFTTSLNATHYKNEVVFVSDDIDFFYSGGADGHSNYVINKVGYPMASFYGYNYLGPIKSAAEASSLPTQIGGNWAGGWKFEDRDGDGAIDPDDRTILGNPHPDLTLGLNLGLTYGNFDFNMFLFASLGSDVYNYQRYYYETGRWGSVFSKEVLTDTWTPERPNARLPQLNIDNSNAADAASSYYIEDGSFLRAKTLQIGYSIPGASLSKIGGSSARIYIQAQNLFTITGYSGIDPQLSNVNIGDGDANDQYMNTDLGNYPTSRILSVGLSLGF